MNIENQVCSLEQAKKIKELGVMADGLFFWNNPMEDKKIFDLISREYAVKCYSDLMVDAQKKHDGIEDGEWFTYDKEEMKDKANQIIKMIIADPQTDALLTAFTVAELGVMLPYEYLNIGDNVGHKTHRGLWKHNNGWGIRFHRDDPDSEHFTNEAEARAAFVIYLLENKLTTPEEVNQRLTH